MGSRIRVIILLLCLFTAYPSGVLFTEPPGQNKIDYQQKYRDRDILEGIELLYNWNFMKAEEIFQKHIKENPDEPIGYFYNAMVTWSRLATGFWSPETVSEYERRVDQTVTVAKNKIKSGKADSFTHFYMGGALGFKARLHLMEQKWFQSFKLALKAVESLEKCHQLDPDNKDVLLGLGIYDYYTAKLSGIFKFLTYLFIRKGDLEEGLRKLDTAANNAVYASVEAKSVLLHIYLFMESRYIQALPLALDLAVRFEDNPRFSHFLGLIYLKLDRKDNYRSVLKKIQERGEQNQDNGHSLVWKHRALYLEACNHMLLNRHDRAREKFEIILEESDNIRDPFMAAFPLLKIGMSYDLEGERRKAIEYYQKIMMMQNGAGAQFLAEVYIETPPEIDDPFLGY